MTPIKGVVGFIIFSVLLITLVAACIALTINANITTCMYDLPEQVCKEKFTF